MPLRPATHRHPEPCPRKARHQPKPAAHQSLDSLPKDSRWSRAERRRTLRGVSASNHAQVRETLRPQEPSSALPANAVRQVPSPPGKAKSRISPPHPRRTLEARSSFRFLALLSNRDGPPHRGKKDARQVRTPYPSEQRQRRLSSKAPPQRQAMPRRTAESCMRRILIPPSAETLYLFQLPQWLQHSIGLIHQGLTLYHDTKSLPTECRHKIRAASSTTAGISPHDQLHSP